MIPETIILEDAEIRLEPLSNIHMNAMVEYALTEPNTWQFSLVSPGGSADAMKQYIEFAVKQYNEGKSYPFAVMLKSSNALVGCTRFYDVDFNNDIATIGYTWYGTKYRRTGINRRCKLLMLTHAFDIWKLERVEFRADINNTVSIEAMKAIGCKEEGVLRSHARMHDGRRTSMVLSILKHEWKNGAATQLKNKIIDS